MSFSLIPSRVFHSTHPSIQKRHKTKKDHHKPGKAKFHTGLKQLMGHLLSTITLIKGVLTGGEGEKHFGCSAEFPGAV